MRLLRSVVQSLIGFQGTTAPGRVFGAMKYREASSSGGQPWRNAASLIIAAPIAESVKFEYSSDYSVLYMKRASRSSFFPNAYVYPGGAVDKADLSSDWFDVFAKIDPEFRKTIVEQFFVENVDEHQSPLFLGDKESLNAGILPNEIAFRICAIRETFEESGLLLLTANPQSQRDHPNQIHAKSMTYCISNHEVEEWRKKIHEDASEFLNLCVKLGQVPDIWSLKEWSQWLTPLQPSPGKKQKRFDTVFYSCCLQEFPSYSSHDQVEMSDSIWKTPAEILDIYMSKKAFLAPPQIIETLKMLNFRTIKDLNEYCSMRASRGLERWTPYILQTKDSHFLSIYPGDDLYPKDYDPVSEIEEWPIIDETYDEISLSSSSKFRMNWGADPASVLSSVSCNAVLRYGQVSPVLLKNVGELSPKL